MAVPNDIREAVARYVAGEITRMEFQEWFAPRAWDVLGEGPNPATDLVSEIELLLAEYGHGDWAEAELRERLAEVASVPLSRVFHIESPVAISVTGGPLQKTILAHQGEFRAFWYEVTEEQVQRVA